MLQNVRFFFIFSGEKINCFFNSGAIMNLLLIFLNAHLINNRTYFLVVVPYFLFYLKAYNGTKHSLYIFRKCQNTPFLLVFMNVCSLLRLNKKIRVSELFFADFNCLSIYLLNPLIFNVSGRLRSM